MNILLQTHFLELKLNSTDAFVSFEDKSLAKNLLSTLQVDIIPEVECITEEAEITAALRASAPLLSPEPTSNKADESSELSRLLLPSVIIIGETLHADNLEEESEEEF